MKTGKWLQHFPESRFSHPIQKSRQITYFLTKTKQSYAF